MKKIQLLENGLPVTPNIEGIFIDNNSVLNNKTIYITRPKYAEIYLEGDMPTDMSDDRIATELKLTFKIGNDIVFVSKCNLSIQGHGSAAYEKKGYTLDFLNADGDSLKVKFGDMIQTDSYHLKAYATDRTHSRGIANCNIWREMMNALPVPDCFINNRVLNISVGQDTNAIRVSDAKYAEDGFPCGVWLNDEFYGLYTLKLKKTRDNYALNNKDMNHIFLDSATYTAFLSQTFDATDWEVKSPKMTGYVAETATIEEGVLSNIQRLWSFTTNVAAKKSEYSNYIVLNHWLCWIIFSELISNRDTNGNNYNLVTWNGTHWSIIPYDLDMTLGLNAWSNYTIETDRRSMDIASANGTNDAIFWNAMKINFSEELKALYATLRDKGIIDIKNLANYYIEQTKYIPRKIYEDDAKKWPCIWNNGEPTLDQIFVFLKNRIEYLDSAWGYNGNK